MNENNDNNNENYRDLWADEEEEPKKNKNVENKNDDNGDKIDSDREDNEDENENILGDSEDNDETPVIETTQEMIDAEYFAPVMEKKKVAEELFDWIEIFSSALLTVILLFTFIFRLVTVQGPSMEQTLHEKENLIISNLFYTPKQGDIVVIQVPNPNFPTPIIKRVIAVEGQEVSFDFEKWLVYVDGEPIYEIDGEAVIEPYVNYERGKYMNGGENITDSMPIMIEPGKIFVMGDNRNHSSDSRSASIGQVDIRNVVGRVLVRVFPFDKFGVVKPNER